ncbi:alpha/beta-hydrolase [Trametes sanguinea]|nr:alpha/beta-hydrolase [Trametes sanguinea]
MQSSDKGFERSHIKIPSMTPGWQLDAWKYMPRASSRTGPPESQGLPVVVMAHGICGNKLMKLAPYAETFASMGFAVVVFDYRRWGASGGTPRHVIYVSEQLEDYRTVVKYCRLQSEFDPHKVVLWGTSFSGGHVVTLATERELNLTAVISQCPFLGTSAPTKLSWAFIKTILRGVQDVLRQAFGLYPTYIPAFAHPGQVGMMNAPGCVQSVLNMVDNERDFPNEVSASSIFELPFYNPNASAARITCPVLVVAAEHDNLCPLQAILELKTLSPLVELVVIPCNHFELYPGESMHEKSLDAMKAFLSQRVNDA